MTAVSRPQDYHGYQSDLSVVPASYYSDLSAVRVPETHPAGVSLDAFLAAQPQDVRDEIDREYNKLLVQEKKRFNLHKQDKSAQARRRKILKKLGRLRRR